jgi:hypothetical protein
MPVLEEARETPSAIRPIARPPAPNIQMVSGKLFVNAVFCVMRAFLMR